MSNTTPILVTGSFTPSGTQDVNIISPVPLPVTGTLTPSGIYDVNILSQAITIAISAVSLPLPSGAATETTQLAIETALNQFTFSSGNLLVTGPLTDTQLRASPVAISGSLTPSGTQDVNIISTISIPVTGTFFQSVQPVSGTVAVSNFPATQPISGTVSATQSGTWNLNNISGTVSLPTGAATESTLSTLNGKVTAVNTGAVTISTALPAGTNLIGHVITDTGSTVSVSNFPATQPISGTVTANAGTNLNTSALALDATLTNASQKTKIVDSAGTNVAAVSATGAVKTDGSAITQPISAASLPLPTGAATESTLSTRLADSTFTGRINSLGQKTSANSTPIVIASDQSNINVVTPQVTNGFSALMQKTAVGTTELNTIYLKNPNASGKTLAIKKIVFTNTHTVDGSWIRLRAYSNPTSSANGTAITVGSLAIGSSATAVATPFNTPTTSANGQQLVDLSVYSGQTEVYECNNRWSVAANNNLLLTVVADAAGRSSAITIVWEEI